MSRQRLERTEYRIDCTAPHDDTCRIATVTSAALGDHARMDDALCQHGSVIRSIIHQWLPA